MLTCNDCGYDERDCVCSFAGGNRGPKLWERQRQPRNKNDEAWDLMQQANKDMDEDVQP